MSIIADTHCHTNACSHAYSTIYENVRAAAQKGLRFLCITEHGPKMADAPHEWYFRNIQETVPDVLEGIVVLKGAEANIMDFQGGLDLCKQDLQKLDWVIASYHTVCCEPGTKEEHTQGWISIAKNPDIDVIGHCGDARYPFDIESAVKAFADNGKIVEINTHSFQCRPGTPENCRKIALCCKEYKIPVVCSSDAHYFTLIGEVQPSLALLKEIDYPEELILNVNYERFLAVAQKKTGRSLLVEKNT